MKRVVMAALGAVVLGGSLASPALADVVVYSFAASDIDYSEPSAFSTDQAGIYDITFSASRDMYFGVNNVINIHYDVFIAPPPRPHSEFLDGNNSFSSIYQDITGSYFTYTLTLPETEISYYTAGNEFLYRGVQPGTLLYSERKYEDAFAYFLVSANSPDPYEYTITVTRRDAPPAPAPEPTAWALMILGFGAVGGAMRTRRRDLAAT